MATSVLHSIVTRWADVPDLIEVVPAAHVIIGDPIVGWPVPSVVLSGYLRSKKSRTASASRIDRITVRLVIEANSAETVEEIASQILTDLLPVDLDDDLKLRAWESYTLDMSRDATSQHYTGSMTIDFVAW